VNGNVAALCAREIVELAKTSGAKLEVNLFHKTLEREKAIEKVLKEAGAKEVLGVGKTDLAHIDEVYSERRIVDPNGILVADVVFVPLEDGDRTEGLVRIGKTVIAVDLNPISRTAQRANITIVDNIVRAVPLLTEKVRNLKKLQPSELKNIVENYDNDEALSEAIQFIENRLHELAKKGIYIDIKNKT